MTKRATNCFTCGEVHRERVPLVNGGGITLAWYVAACGRVEQGEDSWDEIPDEPANGPRPLGVCPRCWASWRKAWAEEEAADVDWAGDIRFEMEEP